MQAVPSSGAQRGQAVIQPAYFTSSLFVDALRADVRELERIYSKHYYYALANASQTESSPLKPFELLKHIWEQLGWQWLHLKILEPRARETFLNVVLRIFLEFTEPSETIMLRVVALFALYTFYMSQPSTSIPRTMFRVDGISIPIDSLERLLDLPESLSGSEQALKPYVQFILQTLQPKFLILPPTDLQAQNPRRLPREEVRNEVDLEEADSAGTGVKKPGRPSRAEKAQKTRAAVSSLDRWLERSSYPAELVHGTTDPAGAAELWRPSEEAESDIAAAAATEQTTHVTLSQRPLASLHSYRSVKVATVNTLENGGHSEALDRAGQRVLQRLKEIDAMAAERGLEVGTEGGELSAIGRVERAVEERRVLSLLEGGGT